MKRHCGWVPTPPKQLEVVEKLLVDVQGSPLFSDVGYQLRGSGKGKLSTPFKSVLHFHPNAFTDDPQETGDCTSHGGRNGFDMSRAVEIHIKGEPESWEARGATEVAYGYRGHSGVGMNVGLVIEFFHKYGGLLRKKYPFADLTKYNPRFGMNLGGRKIPKEILDIASEHPALYWARIKSIEEARDSLANGYGIVCGSNYGNNGVRDKNGLSRWNDSWSHCMAWGACDDTGPQMTFLILQSWGIWNSGGHPAWGPIPGGSFLVPDGDAEKMIRQGECYAIGQVKGWAPQKLPNYGTGTFLS